MPENTRDRAIDYLLDVFTDGGVENSRAAIDAITEHVKEEVEQARKFRQTVCGIVPDEEYTHRPESMSSAEWLPPWDQHTADLRANDGLERKCITAEERAVIEAAKAWASVRPRMKSEIPFTYSNNLFKAVDALEKAREGGREAGRVLTKALTPEPVCHRCSQEGAPPHPCPYQSDVNDDSDFRCTCCEECTQQCAEDI